MRMQVLICVAVLGTLGLGCIASAQGYDRRDDQRGAQQRPEEQRGRPDRGEQERQGGERGDQERRGDERGYQERRGEQRGGEVLRTDGPRSDEPRGAEQDMRGRGEPEREYSARNWHRGDRIPPEYRDRRYVIENWRDHRLAAPPRGYQ